MKTHPPGPYRRPMPRVLGGPTGVGVSYERGTPADLGRNAPPPRAAAPPLQENHAHKKSPTPLGPP